MEAERRFEAIEAMAEILCAQDYRDDSGKTWRALTDVGQDSFRVKAKQLLEGTMPGRDCSAADALRKLHWEEFEAETELAQLRSELQRIAEVLTWAEGWLLSLSSIGGEGK